VQHVAPRGAWQGSRLVPGGRVALLGTTMAPGFDPLDFVPAVRAALVAAYPAHADVVRALTRE
jgi:predicted cupin superfamily sugar epimerase